MSEAVKKVCEFGEVNALPTDFAHKSFHNPFKNFKKQQQQQHILLDQQYK